MAYLKSFDAVLYSDKVEYKGTFSQPLPPLKLKYDAETESKL